MPVFILPIAAAGYTYWDKQQKERLAKENAPQSEEETDECCEEQSSVLPEDKKIHNTLLREGEPVGPIAKFRTFCNNLEKDYAKVQERKRRQQVACLQQHGVSPNRLPKTEGIETKEAAEESAAEDTQSVPTSAINGLSEKELPNTSRGPLARFHTFRENLQKEFTKAEARRLQEAAFQAELVEVVKTIETQGNAIRISE